jgi:hypothetical protein
MLALGLLGIAALAPAQLASLRPNQELRLRRISPTVEKPDGPVLYQILFRSSATPGSIPKISSSFTLTNSLISEDGAGVHIGALAIASNGAITLCCGQSFGSGGTGGTMTLLNTGTGLAGGPITTSGTISIANGGVGADQIAASAVTQGKIGSGAALNGQVLMANGVGTASWQTLGSLPSNTWGLHGNFGIGCTTSPCSRFLGTEDGSSLEFRVNDQRALRIEPQVDPGTGSFAPNMIGGFSGNVANGTAIGATIGGGGEANSVNTVSNHFTTIGGGNLNTASGDAATVGGGAINVAGPGREATVAGGFANSATGDFAVVAGGFGNTASAVKATIAGGGQTDDSNPATGNRVTDDFGVVGGGGGNQAGNGDVDTTNSQFATVSGGGFNVANAYSSAVAGGLSNTASGLYSAVSGGTFNTASGTYSIVAGGQVNTASGGASFAAGSGANTFNHKGAFVWADDNVPTHGFLFATADNQFLARGTGGFSLIAGIDNNGNPDPAKTVSIAADSGAIGIGIDPPLARLHVSSSGGTPQAELDQTAAGDFSRLRMGLIGSSLWDIAVGGPNNVMNFFSGAAGNLMTLSSSGNLLTMKNGAFLSSGGTWTNASDRNAKTKFVAVDAKEILDRIAAIPIQSWSYKSETPSIRHIGPMAQDFFAAFKLGEDDKHITTVDEGGVALAAIQGLNQKLEEKTTELRELVQQKDALLATQQQQIERLERQVAALAESVRPAEKPTPQSARQAQEH